MSQVFATDYIYKLNWRDISTYAIIGITPKFEYIPDVIITEINDCILQRLPNTHLYDKMKPKELQIESTEFISKLKKQNKSVIIMTNAEKPNGRLTNDLIKNKLEWIHNETGLEFICIAALKNGCFLKPHTGMWRLLKALYKQRGVALWQGDYKVSLRECEEEQDFENRPLVVSNYGGVITEDKKILSDIDRAFAWNIGAKFQTVNEFLRYKTHEKFIWNNVTIGLSERKKYVETSKLYKNEKIFVILDGFSKPRSMFGIFIYGAPCSGKTRLAKMIENAWDSSKFADTHAVKRLGSDEHTPKKLLTQFKKLTAQTISVVLDNNLYNDSLRQPFVDELKKYNAAILFIEVDVGIKMAEIFNHARVETATTDVIPLVPQDEFVRYKSKMSAPIIEHDYPMKSIKYIPKIEDKPVVMYYMF